MNADEQLQWEARLSRPAALAAFAAGLLLLVGVLMRMTIPDDRSGVEPLPDFLLSVDESPGSLIAAVALQAAGSLCLAFVFYYLFRAIVHRLPQIPKWFAYIIFLGPAMYAIGQVLSALEQIDVAEMFAERSYRFEDADPGSNLSRCPAIRGELGDDCAEELMGEDPNGLAIGLGFAGTVATAFLFVMLPLRARRAGLLSPFMSILGVIAGVLFVLPLLPGVPVVIQAFWLGAVGVLFLGKWPGGRGPAWETGRPDPWPAPAQRRGLAEPADDADRAETEATREEQAPPEPQPTPERPSSRKRKRKRR